MLRTSVYPSESSLYETVEAGPGGGGREGECLCAPLGPELEPRGRNWSWENDSTSRREQEKQMLGTAMEMSLGTLLVCSHPRSECWVSDLASPLPVPATCSWSPWEVASEGPSTGVPANQITNMGVPD